MREAAEGVEDGRMKRVVQKEERALDTISEQQLFRYCLHKSRGQAKDERHNIRETISRILEQGDDGRGKALLIKSEQQLFEFKASASFRDER